MHCQRLILTNLGPLRFMTVPGTHEILQNFVKYSMIFHSIDKIVHRFLEKKYLIRKIRLVAMYTQQQSVVCFETATLFITLSQWFFGNAKEECPIQNHSLVEQCSVSAVSALKDPRYVPTYALSPLENISLISGGVWLLKLQGRLHNNFFGTFKILCGISAMSFKRPKRHLILANLVILHNFNFYCDKWKSSFGHQLKDKLKK